jgi:hypothetical protein
MAAELPPETGGGRKTVGKVPVWMLAVGGGVVVVVGVWLYKKYAASKSATGSSSSTPSTTGSSVTAVSPSTTAIPLYQDTFTGSPAYQDILNAISALQQPVGPTTTYTVKGSVTDSGGTFSDQYPAGVARAAYGLKQGGTGVPGSDTLDAAVYSTLIINDNRGVTVPYPVGTVLTVPANPTSSTSTTAYTGPNGTVNANTPNFTQQPATLNSIVAATSPASAGTSSAYTGAAGSTATSST